MRTAGTTYFNLGPRLTLTFGALILLILWGNALVVWQFRIARNQTDRLTDANQQLLEVLRLQASLLSFHRRLDELAREMDAHRLVTQAEASRRALREQTQQIRTALANLPSAKVVDSAFLPTLDTIDVTLAAEVEDIFELAESDSTFFIATFFGWSIARHTIKVQEAKFREAIEFIPAMAFVSLPDGYRTFVNECWVEYTGMTVAVVGFRLAHGHSPGGPEASSRRMGGGAGQRKADVLRGPLPARGGRPISLVHGEGGAATEQAREDREMVRNTYDIEDRKRAERERERLRQLEADLARVNRVSTLGEMAASLAHEIKQPIAAAITGANSCVEWLAHEPPNFDRARAAAARIDKYGNRAAEIIDRIRSFYKKSPPQRELVDGKRNDPGNAHAAEERGRSILGCHAHRTCH